MSLRDEKAADLAEILTDIGEAVLYKGQPVSALVTTPAMALALDIGGIGEACDFVVKVARTAVAFDPPAIGDRIEFQGDTFRIIRIGDRAGYSALVLSVKLPFE
ncbi:hypothetical protein DB346_24410 [Verrucomicrobia bacterium LW23]|nr:hypothetical protein DB346_24410 [Verrucomicrobia bacterium LW23]